GTRTRDPQLGRLMLYQLSYSRTTFAARAAETLWWRGKDSNLRRLTPADLQSAPFGRLGTPPYPPFPGAGGGDRTRDLPLTRRLLFQLSYASVAEPPLRNGPDREESSPRSASR